MSERVWDHAAWLTTISAYFFDHSDEWGIRVRTSLTLQTSAGAEHVDVAIYDAAAEPIDYATTSPLVVFLLFGEDDKMLAGMQLYSRLLESGVQRVYLIPANGSPDMIGAREFKLRDHGVTWAEIAATHR